MSTVLFPWLVPRGRAGRSRVGVTGVTPSPMVRGLVTIMCTCCAHDCHHACHHDCAHGWFHVCTHVVGRHARCAPWGVPGTRGCAGRSCGLRLPAMTGHHGVVTRRASVLMDITRACLVWCPSTRGWFTLLRATPYYTVSIIWCGLFGGLASRVQRFLGV